LRILVYSCYFPPTQIGGAKYNGEMVAWLAQQGHEVRVVTAPPYYPAWRVSDGYSAGRYRREQWRGATIWRCPIWIPRQATGAKRILHLLSFALSSAFLVLRPALWKPDVVWLMSPSLFFAPTALLGARLSGASAWLHVQDFEVDAAFASGLLRHPVLRNCALWLERKLMRRFDRVSTISTNMFALLRNKGVAESRCVLFPNWVDVGLIHPLDGHSSFRDELEIPDGVNVALYSGNMGEKQGLDILLGAARLLESDESVRFVLCGDGSARKRLKAEFGALSNVIWLPLQPVERLNDLLNLADIHLLPQIADIADLVMPSKLTGMLASGRPVIATASAGTQVYEVVAQCGVVVPPGDPQALSRAIQGLSVDSGKRQELGEAARRYAVDNMNAAQILPDFERALVSCCKSGARSRPAV
jgi:colanic acid biosynthesis glycosyl transferase WcaI